MKKISILYYAVALIGPILFFCVFTNNTNETYPWAPWIACPILSMIAGLLSGKGFPPKTVIKWVIWSGIIGLAEAFLLTVAV